MPVENTVRGGSDRQLRTDRNSALGARLRPRFAARAISTGSKLLHGISARRLTGQKQRRCSRKFADSSALRLRLFLDETDQLSLTQHPFVPLPADANWTRSHRRDAAFQHG